eukprot:COSAG06_NODE_1799_length_8367_cov_3.030721_6_plen_92_part_00
MRRKGGEGTACGVRTSRCELSTVRPTASPLNTRTAGECEQPGQPMDIVALIIVTPFNWPAHDNHGVLNVQLRHDADLRREQRVTILTREGV